MTEQDERFIAAVRRMYAGDDPERSVVSRNIVWHVPGHNPVSGDYVGYEAYTETMVSRMMPLDRWEFSLQDVMVNGHYVMTTFTLAGERRGVTLNVSGGHLMRLDAEGKVAEGWGFTNDQDALDRFFSA